MQDLIRYGVMAEKDIAEEEENTSSFDYPLLAILKQRRLFELGPIIACDTHVISLNSKVKIVSLYTGKPNECRPIQHNKVHVLDSVKAQRSLAISGYTGSD